MTRLFCYCITGLPAVVHPVRVPVVAVGKLQFSFPHAPMEPGFGRLQVELIHVEQFEAPEEVQSAVFEYIEVFYHQLRRHSASGYVSPAGLHGMRPWLPG